MSTNTLGRTLRLPIDSTASCVEKDRNSTPDLSEIRFARGNLLKTFALTAIVVSAALLSGGCGEPVQTGATNSVAMPQPKLRTMKLWVGPEELTVELALTPQQQSVGMMMRTNLEENAGMFFPLPFTQQASFWMKNCPLPLSAAYINPQGVIVEIHELEPHNTNSVVAASNNIRFVLETSRGWFERHQVKPGVLVRTEQGSLMDTFFQKAR